MLLVSQARPNQPQRGSLSVSVRDTESNPRWGWLGLACETNVLQFALTVCHDQFRPYVLSNEKQNVMCLHLNLPSAKWAYCDTNPSVNSQSSGEVFMFGAVNSAGGWGL